MKKFIWTVIAMLPLLWCRAEFTVVLSPDAGATEKLAAAEFSKFFQEATGYPVKTVSGEAPKSGTRIFIGNNLSAKELQNQEYSVQSDGTDLTLTGGDGPGTLYAVYAFLENQLGCRWYSHLGNKKIPRQKNFVLPVLDYRGKAAYEFRSLIGAESHRTAEAPMFFYRNGLNVIWGNYSDKLETRIKLDVPQCHTLFYFIPPAKGYNPYGWQWKEEKYYFSSNPEFFSMNAAGQRVKNLQLCFSNPELRQEFTRRLYEHIESKGGEGVFHVGAMDWPGPFCYCPGCKELEEKMQTPGAPLYDYLIEACDKLKTDYPKAMISTLAYRKKQSETPPVLDGRLPDNLVIIFAPIDDDFSKPLDHPNNQDTYRNLKKWTSMAKNVWVWYYPLPYGGNAPFGAIERTAADTRLLYEAGCNGTFYEHDVGVPQGLNSSDLLTWMMMQLFKDPYQDYRSLAREFCDAYYGAASAMMYDYFMELDTYTRDYKVFLPWNSSAQVLGIFTPANLDRWQQLFDRMESAAAGEKSALQNVRDCRITLDMQMLGQNWHAYKKAFPDTVLSPESLRKRIEENLESSLERRFADANIRNIWRKRITSLLEDYMLLSTVEPKPLPPPLDRIPAEKIRQAMPRQVNHCGIAQMSDAAFGMAIREEKKPLELPFTLGFYDELNKKFVIHNRKITKEEIVIDQFHLYKLGRAALSAQCLVWLTSTWRASVALGSFQEMGNPFKEWDIYVSLKFEGPGYSSQSKAKEDNVWCDRVVLVETD